MDKIMNKWWNEKHKDDIRSSGNFSWDEIKEFGIFLSKRHFYIILIGVITAFILGVIV